MNSTRSQAGEIENASGARRKLLRARSAKPPLERDRGGERQARGPPQGQDTRAEVAVDRHRQRGEVPGQIAGRRRRRYGTDGRLFGEHDESGAAVVAWIAQLLHRLYISVLDIRILYIVSRY